jgi:hypothetical protein
MHETNRIVQLANKNGILKKIENGVSSIIVYSLPLERVYRAVA